MANLKNLKNFTSEQSREQAAINGRKGGIASGRAKRERKTIQTILNDFLDGDVKSNKQVKEVAKAMGITGDKSIKDVYTLACLLNSMKKCDLSDLERLSKLLGEECINTELEDISDAESDVFG